MKTEVDFLSDFTLQLHVLFIRIVSQSRRSFSTRNTRSVNATARSHCTEITKTRECRITWTLARSASVYGVVYTIAEYNTAGKKK